MSVVVSRRKPSDLKYVRDAKCVLGLFHEYLRPLRGTKYKYLYDRADLASSRLVGLCVIASTIDPRRSPFSLLEKEHYLREASICCKNLADVLNDILVEKPKRKRVKRRANGSKFRSTRVLVSEKKVVELSTLAEGECLALTKLADSLVNDDKYWKLKGFLDVVNIEPGSGNKLSKSVTSLW
jgi:hypothetical protein